jgi:iron complex outermembrane receptor protein
MITLRKSVLATSILVALSASSLIGINQAVAQEATEQADDFEVISISRKRPESLQEVPDRKSVV